MNEMLLEMFGNAFCELRAAGAVVEPRLTPLESTALECSFRLHRRAIDRAAWKYYRSRCDDFHDACDWLMSETYSQVISAVVAGKMAIPQTGRQWIAVAKTIRHRYYAQRKIVIDGQRVTLFGDDDTSVATRINADRLHLDDTAFTRIMIEYARRGLGRKVAPAWVVETITHWIAAPEVSWRDRAAELGISRETVKDREAKCKSAVRAGILGDLVSFED